jgi:hypothetical protein
MPKVGLFISWSGNSRPLAEALREWLPTALHSVDPWMSEEDIHKGARFLEEIDRALAQCQAGIICITPENSHSVWVAFEAGALASRVQQSKLVVPVTVRMRSSDLQGPLAMFQGCQLVKKDMLRLVKSLNELNTDEDRIPEARLLATFEGVWPRLESLLPELELAPPTGDGAVVAQRKPDSQLLEEILDVSKAIRVLVEDKIRAPGPQPAGPEIAAQQIAEAIVYSPMASGSGLQGRDAYTSLAEPLRSASEIWLAGVSLLSIVGAYFNSYLDSVRHKRLTLRFLVLDPDDDLLLETAIRSLYSVSSADDLRQDIRETLAQIRQLQAAADEQTRVEIRYLTSIPSASIILVNPLDVSGTAIAEFYPYRASSSDRPHITLNQDSLAQKKWYLFYRDQFRAMWRDGRSQQGADALASLPKTRQSDE